MIVLPVESGKKKNSADSLTGSHLSCTMVSAGSKRSQTVSWRTILAGSENVRTSLYLVTTPCFSLQHLDILNSVYGQTGFSGFRISTLIVPRLFEEKRWDIVFCFFRGMKFCNSAP